TIAVAFLLGADHHRLNAEVLKLPVQLLLWNPSLRTAVVALLGLASCLVLAGIVGTTRQGRPVGRGWSILLVAVVAGDLVWV
ncbi:MAG: hypothetical protein GTO31_11465, partial [Xanthomonadales bacterium]|nr:hypothetical protein [Xanthomonadales bacterium]